MIEAESIAAAKKEADAAKVAEVNNAGQEMSSVDRVKAKIEARRLEKLKEMEAQKK